MHLREPFFTLDNFRKKEFNAFLVAPARRGELDKKCKSVFMFVAASYIRFQLLIGVS